MATAAQLREEIESALARRMHAPLTLRPRLVAHGHHTGYETLDALIEGGLPVAGTTEIIGTRSSGRTSIAAAYIAERTRHGHLCAWVDVGLEMDPEACQANGADLERLLLIRCAGTREEPLQTAPSIIPKFVPKLELEIAPKLEIVQHVSAAKKYRKDKSIGTPGVPNRPLAPAGYAAAAQRREQVASDRQPARRGVFVLQQKADSLAKECAPATVLAASVAASAMAQRARAQKPWSRLEQGIKAVDLLLQSGGFGAIVFDLGGIAPQFAQRIPLATWFRWRAALERTRTSLVVLSQSSCTGSSAELALRVQAEVPEQGTVMMGVPYRLEVMRRRFGSKERADDNATYPPRKGPQRASAASGWSSRTPWVSWASPTGARSA